MVFIYRFYCTFKGNRSGGGGATLDWHIQSSNRQSSCVQNSTWSAREIEWYRWKDQGFDARETTQTLVKQATVDMIGNYFGLKTSAELHITGWALEISIQ